MGQKKAKGRKNSTDSLKHLDLDTANAASSNDCTGLIPAAPATEEAREAYEELYGYDAQEAQK